MNRQRKLILAVGLAIVALGATTGAILLTRGRQAKTLRGAVITQAADPRKQSPIAGVEITLSDGVAPGTFKSDSSGFFDVRLRRGVKRGKPVTLKFRHPGYQPLDLTVAANDTLYVAAMIPVHHTTKRISRRPQLVVSNVFIRYSLETKTSTNVGSGVKTFQVVNKGNVPCNGHQPCSPDGKWKAAVASASLDAGVGNEFRDARVSCIAGPCPFTRIDSDRFSQGGQVISVSVRNWSDTTTFLMQAELFRSEMGNVMQNTYPVILGRAMNFTLPPAAEGPSIQAEINGKTIVFPLAPNPCLSWTNCDVRVGSDHSRSYRCQLKQGYRFR